VTRLTRSPGLDDYPACSPDGSRIAFVSNRDGQFEVIRRPTATDRGRDVSRHPLGDTYPTWTPDGLGVTFVSQRDGGFDLYTRAVGALRTPHSKPVFFLKNGFLARARAGVRRPRHWVVTPRPGAPGFRNPF